MKQNINYYYNLLFNDIHHYNDEYYFTINSEYYLLLPCIKDINRIKFLYDFLKKHQIYCLQIINNKDNNLITVIDDKSYILLKDYIYNRVINLYDIINYSIYIDINYNCNWYNLWTEKLDYYEYQMEEYETKYPILYESFFYYDGLTELAISLLNSINLKNIHGFICHQRITNRSTLRDLYNPIEMIIDTRVRDSAEYFKYSFFYSDLDIRIVDNYIINNNLTNEEATLFLIRMIYPSYYFDLYDKIISNSEKENKIKKIIIQNAKYEQLLKHIYKVLISKYTIPQIEWFNS